MKQISILAMSLAALTWAACDDDSYDDWVTPSVPEAEQQQQEEARNVVDGASFTIVPAAAIDYANVAEGTETLKIFTPTLTLDESGAEWQSYSVLLGGTQTLDATSAGYVDADALRSTVEAIYGKAPYPRTLSAVVTALATTPEGLTLKLTDETEVYVTLKAPVIEEEYYYVGTANGWSDQQAAGLKFEHNGEGNVYDYPTFTITVPASVDDMGNRVDEWFKVAPASAYTSGDFWNTILGCPENGTNPVGATTNLIIDGAQAFNAPGTDGASYYRITIDMMNYTLTAEAIYSDPQIWYLVGGCIADGSWGNEGTEGIGKTLIPLYVPNGFDGTTSYTGYITTENWGFKLIKTPGSWDEQMGSTDDALTPGGGGNFNVPANGYYTVTYNQVSGVLSITAADIAPATWERITLSGDFNGWGDTEMTPVTTTAEGVNHDWWADITVDADGGIKFKGNADWGTNWGYSTFPYGAGEQNGANIPITAGSWRVVFNDITGSYIFFSTDDDLF